MALFSEDVSREEEPAPQRRRPGRASRKAEGRPGADRLAGALSLLALVVLWALAAWLAHSRHFPGPLAVGERIIAGILPGEGSGVTLHLGGFEVRVGELPYHTCITLARVAASFAIALAIGSPIGIALGRSRKLDLFFDSWLILFLNLPALIIIILCFVWFGQNEVAAVTAVALNKIPNVAVILREGTQALSRKFDEMAAIYHFGWWTRMRHVLLPQLAPYFAVAGRSGLAIVWKIVLVVELLGLSSGVGFKLNTYFQLFDVTSILAYSLSFIAVIFVIESLVLRPWQLAANRWRQ
jgi:NitT/TauT family transport system permease protein